jgi:hypothetical protein
MFRVMGSWDAYFLLYMVLLLDLMPFGFLIINKFPSFGSITRRYIKKYSDIGTGARPIRYMPK